jgi:hypothetical protein
MRRFLLFAGVAVFAFLTFAAISTSNAASRDFLLQVAQETEPNNDFNTADEVIVPGSITGSAWNSVTDTDFFSMTVQVGREYEADLTIASPEGMQLRMVLYDRNRNTVRTSSSSSTNTNLSWTAYTDFYYVKVAAIVLTSTQQMADYNLEIFRIAQEPTPTDTQTPTITPTPLSWGDEYEPNDNFSQAYRLPVEVPIVIDPNIYPVNNEDWFKIWAKDGKWYEVTVDNLSGIDSYVEIRNGSNAVVASDDDGAGGYASQVDWGAGYDGYYYIRVINKVGTTGTYDLTVEEISAPGPAPTAGPGPGIDDQADNCENNLNFDQACVIPANEYLTFNFTPPLPDMVDNDFYKLWIKPGLIYNCATSDLSPGVDPNMIVYDQNRNAIGGNDDVAPGNLNSSFAYYSTYEGWLYLLVGTGDRTPSDLYDSDYTLRCTREVPGQATATPAPSQSDPDPTATPTSVSSPLPTPTVPPAAAQLDIRTLATPTPQPTEEAGLHFIPVDLIVYYDANEDRSPGAGEGVAGVFVLAYDTATGEEIAQGFTDELGHLEFTAAAEGIVRLSIPYLGVGHLVGEGSGTVYVRIAPGAVP